jgi:hypothetical protein
MDGRVSSSASATPAEKLAYQQMEFVAAIPTGACALAFKLRTGTVYEDGFSYHASQSAEPPNPR